MNKWWNSVLPGFGKRVLALCLVGCLALSMSCNRLPNWINVAKSDLPILLNVAISIATLATLNNPNASAADIQVAQKISQIASQGLNEVQVAYDAAQSDPSATNTQKVLAVANAVVANIGNELDTAQIENPTLRAQVTAAANLILDAIESFVSLIPGQAPAVANRRMARHAHALPWVKPNPDDIRDAWDTQVCNQNASCMVLVK